MRNISQSMEIQSIEILQETIENLYVQLANKEKEMNEKLERQKEYYEKEINKLKNTSVSQPEIEIIDSETIQNFEKLNEIDSGSYGTVYKVAKRQYYALKVIKRNAPFESVKRLFLEYEIINILNHPNIIKVFGVHLDDQTPSILLEYCPNNLHQSILNKELTSVQIVFGIYQIVEGMRYVHYKKIIHRDLKPSNILIDSIGVFKIADFGVSKFLTTEEQLLTFGIGTQKFMAPEIIDECEYYDEKVDVYSFGVLMYFMLSGGSMPKIKLSDVIRGKKAEIPTSFSKFAADLIDRCWNFDPKDRPSFEDILNEIESNDYNLLELTRSKLASVRSLIENHKRIIPQYS